MPNRIVREGILSSQRVDLLKWEEEVFYRRLHSIVDDYGRFEANPKLLRSRCYPLRVDKVREADISRWLTACEIAGLILLYESAGKEYLQVCDFRQTTRTPSRYPNPQVLFGADDSNCEQMKSNARLDVSVSVSGGEGVDEGEGVESPPHGAANPMAYTPWGIWIECNRKKGRKDPLKHGADLTASGSLWKAAEKQADRYREWCMAYLDDRERFIVNAGHELRYLKPAKYENRQIQVRERGQTLRAAE